MRFNRGNAMNATQCVGCLDAGSMIRMNNLAVGYFPEEGPEIAVYPPPVVPAQPPVTPEPQPVCCGVGFKNEFLSVSLCRSALRANSETCSSVRSSASWLWRATATRIGPPTFPSWLAVSNPVVAKSFAISDKPTPILHRKISAIIFSHLYPNSASFDLASPNRR